MQYLCLNYDGTPGVLVKDIAPMLNISEDKFMKKLNKLTRKHPEISRYFNTFYDGSAIIYRDGMNFLGDISKKIDRAKISDVLHEFHVWDEHIKSRTQEVCNEINTDYFKAGSQISEKEKEIYLKSTGLTYHMIRMNFTDDEIEAILDALYNNGLFEL